MAPGGISPRRFQPVSTGNLILPASPGLTAKHLIFRGTSVSGYWNLIIRSQLYVKTNLDYLFYCIKFTVSYIGASNPLPMGRFSRHRRQAAISGSRLKDSGNLSQASSTLCRILSAIAQYLWAP